MAPVSFAQLLTPIASALGVPPNYWPLGVLGLWACLASGRAWPLGVPPSYWPWKRDCGRNAGPWRPGCCEVDGVTRVAKVNASRQVGGLFIKAEPNDIVSFSSEWSIAAKAVVKGVTVHVLVANWVTVYLDNDLATNPLNPLDVDGENGVSPLDVLVVINHINRNFGPGMRIGIDSSSSYLEVDGDHFVTPLDVLWIINWLNGSRDRGSGEGEAPTHEVATDAVFQEMGNVDLLD